MIALERSLLDDTTRADTAAVAALLHPQWSEVDFSMEVPDDVTATQVLDAFHEAVAASEAIMAGVELADPLDVLVDGQQLPVRWVLAHKTSEIARHAGHADILRELIDGITGR